MQQYIGFTLNENEYTIPIVKVREIINIPVITRMPQSPPYIEGISNLRGSVIPIVSLKKLVNLGDNGDIEGRVIVVASGKVTFGVLVDGITGVINIDESAIEPPENFLNGHMEQIEGIAKLHDRLVVLLNTRKLIPFEDMSLFEDIVVDVKETFDSEKVEVVRKLHTMAGEVEVKELHNAKEFLSKKFDIKDPKNQILENLMQFMEAIAKHEYGLADNIIEQMIRSSGGELFKEVGKITRRLHDSLKSFKEAIDPKFKEIASINMPKAVDRLRYVIERTEEAANKTLGIVEKYILTMDDLAAQIRKLKEPEDAVQYLKSFKNSLEDDLTEIITTQSFQDLTGQTIKKVITLVEDIEEELVKLITTFGVKIEPRASAEEIAPEKVSQSDVDELLKGLGF